MLPLMTKRRRYVAGAGYAACVLAMVAGPAATFLLAFVAAIALSALLCFAPAPDNFWD
jgi:hypothetical protein